MFDDAPVERERERWVKGVVASKAGVADTYF